MTLFLTVFAASVLGQALVLYVVGALAVRKERQQAEATRQALTEYNAALLKERQRMAEYVKLEG